MSNEAESIKQRIHQHAVTDDVLNRPKIRYASKITSMDNAKTFSIVFNQLVDIVNDCQRRIFELENKK